MEHPKSRKPVNASAERRKMLRLINKTVTIVTLLLAILCAGQLMGQQKRHKPPKPSKAARKAKKEKKHRLEKKALRYEENLKKTKETGRLLLAENEPDYTKLEKLKKKVEKLSAKVEKSRYKLKTKRFIKLQERATKRRMRKSLKSHRSIKANRRHRR